MIIGGNYDFGTSAYHFSAFSELDGNPTFVQARQEVVRLIHLFRTSKQEEETKTLEEALHQSLQLFKDFTEGKYKDLIPHAKIECLLRKLDLYEITFGMALVEANTIDATVNLNYFALLESLTVERVKPSWIIDKLNMAMQNNKTFAHVIALTKSNNTFQAYLNLLNFLRSKDALICDLYIRAGFKLKFKDEDFFDLILKNQTDFSKHEILFKSGLLEVSKENKDQLVNALLAIPDRNHRQAALLCAWSKETEMGKFIRTPRFVGTETGEHKGSLKRIKDALHQLDPSNPEFQDLHNTSSFFKKLQHDVSKAVSNVFSSKKDPLESPEKEAPAEMREVAKVGKKT